MYYRELFESFSLDRVTLGCIFGYQCLRTAGQLFMIQTIEKLENPKWEGMMLIAFTCIDSVIDSATTQYMIFFAALFYKILGRVNHVSLILSVLGSDLI